MEDVRNKISKANGAFNQLQKIWKSSDISLRTKLRIFNSNVKSVLLYQCEHEWGREATHTGYWWESQKEGDHWEDQDVDGWTILKWILER
jgi:hypothetical protein